MTGIDNKAATPIAQPVKTTLGLLPMIALSAALTGPAGAQNEVVLDEINIDGGTANGTGTQTGYKRDRLKSKKSTAPLIDTPTTVTVVPEEVIKERGATTLTEVLRNTPGISFNAGENGFSTGDSNFQMRGFDASGSVFIDGSRSNGAYKRDAFNTEQVEVIKGPSADNGRGGPSGYVNMVTKTPTLNDFVRGDASLTFDEYGTDPLKRATFDVNKSFDGNIAVRLNGMVEGGGVMGRDVAQNRAWGFAPSVAFGLDGDFRAILAYEHFERKDRPDWGVPGATIPGLVTYNPATLGARRDSYYGLISDYDKVRSDSLMARLEYDVNDNVTISNQTKWSAVDRDARYTVPTDFTAPSTVPTQTQFYDRNTESFSNQTNLTAEFETGGVKHVLSAGVDLSREKSFANRLGTVNSNTDLFNPDPTRPVVFPGATQFNNITVNSAAAYVYNTATLNEQWQIAGGLRAEYYNVDITDRTTAGVPQALDGFTDSQFTLNGKLGVIYKPVKDTSLYASFGVSTLPPGSYLSNPDISRTGENAFPGFVAGAKPSQSYNYEIGAKKDFFDGALSVTAAAFHTVKKNVPIFGRTDAEVVAATPSYLAGYGEQIVQGIEIGVAGAITPAWNVFGGAVFLNSKRRHSAALDRMLYNQNPGDRGNDPTISVIGDQLAFTPNVSANLWTTYDVTEKFRIGGGLQYVGSAFLGRPDDANRVIPNGRFGKLPGYTLVNLMASYKATDNIAVQFNIDNLLNETYAMSTNWNGSRASLGAPRTFRISTSFNF